MKLCKKKKILLKNFKLLNLNAFTAYLTRYAKDKFMTKFNSRRNLNEF